MIDFWKNWWQIRQIKTAIQKGDNTQAERLIKHRQQRRIKLSLLENLFLENLQLKKDKSQILSDNLKKDFDVFSNLKPELNIIHKLEKSFNLIEYDPYKIQCLGIDSNIFDSFEENLVDYLISEFEKTKLSSVQLKKELMQSKEDLEKLKRGLDPDYNYRFSPHIYLMQYFLENVYCNYLACFLIYKLGYLHEKIKILDIAAGPGTFIFGLGLFLRSLNQFFDISRFHISYYSLEQQSLLQYRGLQFWRQFLEKQAQSFNIFFQFNTQNIFDYKQFKQKLPNCFFDFIIISHCFFYDEQQRMRSHTIYKDIFQKCLTSQGKVLLIVQSTKLYKLYDSYPEENIEEENYIINQFLKSLGLKLIWYKYLTSTGKRTPMGSDFRKFATDNLPEQSYLSNLKQKYFNQSYISNYVIDDFVILAQVDYD